MPVNSTSYQFSAVYGTSVAWKKGAPPDKSPVKPEDIENARPIPLEIKQLPYEDGWAALFGVETTETVNADGAVTKTASGGVNFIGADNFGSICTGRTGFWASMAFDPATYKGGQLGATADFMAAARAVAQEAMNDHVKSIFNAGPNVLEIYEGYPGQRDAVAKSFAGMVGTPLEDQGRAGEWDKVYKSVHAVFASFEAKYEAVTASGDGSWKDTDFWTATVKLQKLGASFRMESGRATSLYSLRELEFAALGLRSAGMSLKA